MAQSWEDAVNNHHWSSSPTLYFEGEPDSMSVRYVWLSPRPCPLYHGSTFITQYLESYNDA